MSRLSSAPIVVLMTGVFAACAGGGSARGSENDVAPPSSGSACAPADATLGSEATLVGMEGSYRVVAVSDDGRRTEGRMELVERPAGMRSSGSTTLPLQGTADIDFAAVGGFAPVEMESPDAARPGVLVLERDGATGRQILVRFGADANDLARPLFDGSETRLEPREIGPDGFRGTWRSGTPDRAASGYFCAWPG